MERNLYRIDDLLLRAGTVLLLLTVLAAAGLVVVGLAQGRPGDGDGDPGVAMLMRFAFPLVAATTGSIGLLTTGFVMRRREKRALAFWRLIDQQIEIHVPDLVANSDLTRLDLDRSIRLLNNKGLGFYVWDRKDDVVRDGRLESVYLHVEKCDVCHAGVAIQVPASLREIPLCPYCGDPVSIERLQELKRASLARMRAEAEPEPAAETTSLARAWGRASPGRGRAASSDFSVVVFLLLLVSFWPAALVYAWYKWQA
jgi:hypothetical protein